PIDIDPIHGMDDPRSGPRREYKDMLEKWAKVMQGRLVVYDYDQSMLVWRDLPNPSHMAFKQDVKHYRKAGILGVDPQSRHALPEPVPARRTDVEPGRGTGEAPRRILPALLRSRRRADGAVLGCHLQGLGRHHRHGARVLRGAGGVHAGPRPDPAAAPGGGR